mmetsp:Transcript_160030/g.513449  ORF Transcript_160030/g.513449 Transcript_160030/m.513449 type:complete len:360 (-) Transcript_160030:257-1336(-)
MDYYRCSVARHAALAPDGFEFFGHTVEWKQGETEETWFLYRRDFVVGPVKFRFREECRATIFATKRADREYHLDRWEDLLDFIKEADVKFLRREYFTHVNDMRLKDPSNCPEARLQMRQKIDPKWFATNEELRQSGMKHLYVISHCWESREHPDPLALQVAQLVAGRHRVPTGFCFIDFCCLYQQPRTLQQQVVFDKALSNMAVLYAHACTKVFRIEASPTEDRSVTTSIRVYDDEHKFADFKNVKISDLYWNPRPYGQRGWCIAERQWAVASGFTEELSRKNATNVSAVPWVPEVFQRSIAQGELRFTHRNDTLLVIELQEKMFWNSSCITKRQEFSMLQSSCPPSWTHWHASAHWSF